MFLWVVIGRPLFWDDQTLNDFSLLLRVLTERLYRKQYMEDRVPSEFKSNLVWEECNRLTVFLSQSDNMVAEFYQTAKRRKKQSNQKNKKLSKKIIIITPLKLSFLWQKKTHALTYQILKSVNIFYQNDLNEIRFCIVVPFGRRIFNNFAVPTEEYFSSP